MMWTSNFVNVSFLRSRNNAGDQQAQCRTSADTMQDISRHSAGHHQAQCRASAGTVEVVSRFLAIATASVFSYIFAKEESDLFVDAFSSIRVSNWLNIMLQIKLSHFWKMAFFYSTASTITVASIHAMFQIMACRLCGTVPDLSYS